MEEQVDRWVDEWTCRLTTYLFPLPRSARSSGSRVGMRKRFARRVDRMWRIPPRSGRSEQARVSRWDETQSRPSRLFLDERGPSIHDSPRRYTYEFLTECQRLSICGSSVSVLSSSFHLLSSILLVEIWGTLPPRGIRATCVHLVVCVYLFCNFDWSANRFLSLYWRLPRT